MEAELAKNDTSAKSEQGQLHVSSSRLASWTCSCGHYLLVMLIGPSRYGSGNSPARQRILLQIPDSVHKHCSGGSTTADFPEEFRKCVRSCNYQRCCRVFEAVHEARPSSFGSSCACSQDLHSSTRSPPAEEEHRNLISCSKKKHSHPSQRPEELHDVLGFPRFLMPARSTWWSLGIPNEQGDIMNLWFSNFHPIKTTKRTGFNPY